MLNQNAQCPCSAQEPGRSPGASATGKLQAEELTGGAFGHQTALTGISGYVVSVAHHAAHLALPSHSHRRASVNLILAGAYEESLDGSSRTYGPLSLIAKPAGTRHANAFRLGGAESLLIEVSAAEEEALAGCGEFLRRPSVLHGSPAVLPGLRIVSELRSTDSFSCLVIETAILELLTATASLPEKLSPSAPAWLSRTVEALHVLPPEELSLAGLAEAAGVHRVHLAKTFKQRFGVSVGNYARRQRTMRAVDRIVHSRQPLSHISADCNFSDQSHMNRSVKAATGFTPGSLRTHLGIRQNLGG